MQIELSEEQQMIQALAREVAEKEVKPVAALLDAEARFPHETVKRMGELGLMGIAVPEAYGGSGADTVAYVLALEEIAKACASPAGIMSVNNSLYCDPILKYGTDEQRKKFLAPFASGQQIGCFALTEPQAGSDATNQHTLAVRGGDGYVLNGRKVFVTNGREASVALVFAQTDPAKAHRGISAFLIERGTPGFLVPKVEDKLGIRASDTAEFVFEECRVRAANRLGEEGMGFKISMGTLDGGRIGIWAAAAWKDAGRPFGPEASMAKLFASEMAMKVATDAIQVHGGYGYIKEYQVERYFRDAKITQIYEGTSQIQKLIIARHVLGAR